MSNLKQLNSVDLGLIEYSQALKIQQNYVEKKQEIIFVCEHPSVVTLGRSVDSKKDIINNHIQIIEVERGGRATLHLPGQVVVYPLVNVDQRKLDAIKILRLLEKAIQNTLLDFRIESKIIENKTGVWVGKNFEQKVASIGIAIKNSMNFHGLSLNVCCNLESFKSINPCGFKPEVMTNMIDHLSSEYKKTWNLNGSNLLHRVKLRIAEEVQTAFD